MYFNDINLAKAFLDSNIKLNPKTNRKIQTSGKIYIEIISEIKSNYPSLFTKPRKIQTSGKVQNKEEEDGDDGESNKQVQNKGEEENGESNKQVQNKGEEGDGESNKQVQKEEGEKEGEKGEEDDENFDYDNLKKIGKGSYGIVYIGEKNGISYAIKRNLVDDSVDFLGSIRELDLMMRLRHPNIVRIRELIHGKPFKKEKISKDTKDDEIHFVTELGIYDLHKLIYNYQRNNKFMKLIMTDVLLGLEYAHSKNIIHRDIKPSNILIFKNGKKYNAKLCDFGLSKPFTYQGIQSPRVLTSCYRPPEVIKKYKYDTKVDIWSIGCVFFEMFTRKRIIPSLSDNNEDIERSLKKSIDKVDGVPYYISLLPKDIPDNFISLITSCLEIDTDKRFTATQALNHIFFDSLRDYIECVRSSYQPDPPSVPLFVVSSRPEREHMAVFFTNCINEFSKASWYKPRRFFLAIDIFDRYLIWCETNNFPFLSKDETIFYCYMSLYISIKYYTCTDIMPSFTNIATKTYWSKEYMKKGMEFENTILKIFDYKIYRQTVYEATDHLNIHLNSSDLSKLLHLILFKSNTLINKSIVEIASKLFSDKSEI
jgi:serine/threonine protein kinase